MLSAQQHTTPTAEVTTAMSKLRTIAALAAVSAVATVAGGTGTALAQSAGDATVTVGPVTTLSHGDKAPFDAPGVRAIRRGQDIPSGYRLVGRTVSGGGHGVGAAIRFQCPDGKRLKSFGVTGHAGFASTSTYVDHRVAWVMSTPPHAGDTGTLYAVCR
jgi:hypothetical protein